MRRFVRRVFAKASVASVEAHLKFPRDKWDSGAALNDDDIVTFFLEEPTGGEGFLFHAFVDSGDPAVFFGSIGAQATTQTSLV